MLMAAMRLNIPVIFVSGGPMEAGKTKLANPTTHTLEFKKLDLVDAMVIAADSTTPMSRSPRSSARPAPPAVRARACSPPTP